MDLPWSRDGKSVRIQDENAEFICPAIAVHTMAATEWGNDYDLEHQLKCL